MFGDEIKCKICDKLLTSKSFHGHLKNVHKLYPVEYYSEYYPRYSLLDKKPIPYKSRSQYFTTYFTDGNEMKRWIQVADNDTVKRWVRKAIGSDLKSKNRNFMFSHAELRSTDGRLPTYFELLSIFDNIEQACDHIGCDLLFDIYPKISRPALDPSFKVLIDTREQDPLQFESSELQKLMVGDYCLDADHYNYTYVDRKSEEDFKSTITVHFDRFCREVERCVDIGAYLFVVVEASIEDINTNQTYHKHNMLWVWNRFKLLQQKYPNNLQFIFSGGREISERIIPKILYYGKDLWNLDMQYLLEKKGVIHVG